MLATLQAVGQRVPSPRQRQVQLYSTTVQAHQYTARDHKKGPQALVRCRSSFSTKLHLAGDGAGGLLAFALTAGQAGNAPQATALLTPLPAPAQQGLVHRASDFDALHAQMGRNVGSSCDSTSTQPLTFRPIWTHSSTATKLSVINRLKQF